VGSWYTIGLFLGAGLGLGVILSGLLGVNAVGAGIAAVAGAAVGAGLAWTFGTPETIAGAVGGLVGALSAAVVVRGALARGATRMGLAAYLGAVGLLLVLLAAVPLVGYVAVVALPALALRMRGRQAERFAGLRTLAK
jgi:hypothetical protein